MSVDCPSHPGEQARGQCVVCGAPVCRQRGVAEGAAFLCESHGSVRVIQGWAQVYSTSSDVDAELVRDNLQAEGVDARVLSQKDHFFAPVSLGDLSPVRVLVPAFDYGEAWRVIERHKNRDGEVSFACANCGEAYDADADVCATCGAPIAG